MANESNAYFHGKEGKMLMLVHKIAYEVLALI